jgi:hypothetical protein
MGTRYHSSTTERERRDIWALLWRFKLQTISMVSAEISGLRSSKQALGGRIWGRIRILFFYKHVVLGVLEGLHGALMLRLCGGLASLR